MPELPEVETVRIQLQRKVIGKTIDRVEVFHGKSVAHNEQISTTLCQKVIADIDRVGKLLIFSFVDETDLFLLAHLKMTGQFFYVGSDRNIVGGGHSQTATDRTLPGRHTRVAFHFTDHTTLFFNDMRLFGFTKTATAEEVARARAGYGPEPIATDFNAPWFIEKVRTRRTSIKATLLDQSFIAGLGNIYVDEALWRAGVRPSRRADRVTKKEAAAIATAAGDVMRESIAVGGTTFQHFVDTGGENGNFSDHLQVFGRHGKICARCGATIKKIRCAGRGTHYCPGCQK